jgi:hypothetical protein
MTHSPAREIFIELIVSHDGRALMCVKPQPSDWDIFDPLIVDEPISLNLV